ncbi:MAG: phosphopantetheine adenylyltransferase [Candidatus Bathyarchaeota archaeon]|nr:MAG: phosphopantetheine adenylyltransferase [Candidatus Bathyarchaeota archaeon]
MTETYGKVAVGGTFDLLHKGHDVLIRKALTLGEFVIIGLTSDAMMQSHPKSHFVEPFAIRRRKLIAYLDELNALEKTDVVPLNDPYGPVIEDEDIDALVASYETFQRGNEINALRCEKGFKPIVIVVVDAVLAEDGKPISTTRIRLGEIDRDGRILQRYASPNNRENFTP